MVPALLIMVREGFEAALVVALLLAYLRKTDRLDMARYTWIGVATASALSVALGVTLHVTVGGLVGAARLRSFAAISLLAVAVLTWMIFWMRRQSKMIKNELEHKVDRALGGNGPAIGLVVVSFLAVLREGIEAALFLVAAASDSDGGAVATGGALGLLIAGVLGALVYTGGRRLPMRSFFKVTGVVLIVFAAGLVARSVLFLQSAGDLGTANNAVYDLTAYPWLTQGTEVGKFLAAMFGWDPRPSIEQVIGWLLYIVPVTVLFLRGEREPAAASRPSTAGTPARTPAA